MRSRYEKGSPNEARGLRPRHLPYTIPPGLVSFLKFERRRRCAQYEKPYVLLVENQFESRHSFRIANVGERLDRVLANVGLRRLKEWNNQVRRTGVLRFGQISEKFDNSFRTLGAAKTQ